jgi:Na+-translocating ferredoxin:NAD+ oxidoreductase RnfD subunit
MSAITELGRVGLGTSGSATTGVADRWYSEKRLGGLSRFAAAITLLNIAGHLFLGFEQSWVTPFVALAAAYGTELLGETVEARVQRRRPRFAGSFLNLVKFLLAAHITALAVAMLLYACEQLWVIAFAAASAIASKYVFRMRLGISKDENPQMRHFLNPSNVGITVTLVLFPTVGIAPPYQFAENTWGIVDWLLPLIVIGTGSYLNSKATGRIPLILAWVAGFALQALVRSLIHGTPLLAGLVPMSGFAFILFTFYMITDPATSPARPGRQVAFGFAVGLAYAVFMELHVVFGLFYALTAVTAARGIMMYRQAWFARRNKSDHVSVVKAERWPVNVAVHPSFARLAVLGGEGRSAGAAEPLEQAPSYSLTRT